MQGKPLQQKTETSSDSDTDESVEVKTTKRVFIKTIETKDGKILSQKTEEKSGNLASTYNNVSKTEKTDTKSTQKSAHKSGRRSFFWNK